MLSFNDTLIRWWCYEHVLMKSGSKTEAPKSTTHDHYVLHIVHFASDIFNIVPLVLDCHIQILASSGEVCGLRGFVGIWTAKPSSPWVSENGEEWILLGYIQENHEQIHGTYLASIAINCWQFVNFSLYDNVGSTYSRIKPEVEPITMRKFWLLSWTLIKVTKLNIESWRGLRSEELCSPYGLQSNALQLLLCGFCKSLKINSNRNASGEQWYSKHNVETQARII